MTAEGNADIIAHYLQTGVSNVYPVKAARREALETKPPNAAPPDDRVAPEEWREILCDALTVRNGWKRILARCAEQPARLCLAQSNQPQ